MKKTVFFRSALRQPVRSLFILLLVGVISFAFAARVGEYSLISQEQEELLQYYRSVGSLVPVEDSDSTYLLDGVTSYLEQNPYIAYMDPRHSVSGVIQDGYYNANAGPGSFWMNEREPDAEKIYPWEMYFYGTYTGGLMDKYIFMFNVDEVIAGYPEYVAPDKTVCLYAPPEAFGDYVTEMKLGARYLLRATRETTAMQSVGLATVVSSTDMTRFVWLPLAPDLPWSLQTDGNVDLSLPEYATLANEIKQCHDNACALSLTATADMSTIAAIQSANYYESRYYLVDGRWLDHEDDLAGSRVIVIPHGLALARDLAIGDTITLTLRDTSYAYDGHYYVDGTGYLTDLQPIGYELSSQTETFEIVGIYGSTPSPGGDRWGSLVNQFAYIPLSVFPETFHPALDSDGTLFSGPYTLVLDSPEHEDAFLDATREDLAAMGYTVTFRETGYRTFKSATEGIGATARSNVLLFAVIVAVCFCLACFVYFQSRRRDLAISRALGVPIGKCVTASALPLVLTGCVGIAGGSVPAWNYTQANADRLVSTLVEAAGVEGTAVTLSMTTLAALDLALAAALLVLALGSAWLTARRPVLSQLQGGRTKR